MQLIRSSACIGFLVLWCLSFGSAEAQETPAPVIDLGVVEEGQLLGRQLSYTEDPNGTWTLSDILAQESSLPFRTGRQEVLNLGFSNATLWIRLTLNNPDATSRELQLEYGYPVIDHLTLYNETDPGYWQIRRAGDMEPQPDTNLAENRNLTFTISVPPGQSRIFLQIRGQGALQAPIKLWSKDGLQKHMLKEYALLVMIYGAFLVMIFYNLLLCLWFRSRAYLYYVVFTCASTLNFMNLQGLTQVVFPRSIGTFLSNELALIANFNVVLCLNFGRLFLDVRTAAPRFDRLFRWFAFVSILSMFVSLVSYNAGIKLFILQTFIVSAFLMAGGIYRSIQGFRPAYFFTLSWTFVLAGHVLYQLAVVGVLSFNLIITFSSFLGSGVEIVLLSLAMGDKMRFEQQTARREISSLNQHLEKLVEDKTRNIRSILKHIRQGVFMIGADRKIMADSSDYLQDIFEEAQFEGRDAFDLLFKRSGVSSDQVDQSATAIKASFHEPILAFDLNEHLLCHEFTHINSRGEKRILECDWNPMTKDDVIDKFLVTVKDVTEHRTLERKTQEQEEVLKMLAEITNIDASTFQRFVTQSQRLLTESLELNARASRPDERTLRRILVNLHTLKGTARSLFLSAVAEATHQLEQRFHEAALTNLNLEHGLKEIGRIIERYNQIAEEKLGRRSARSMPLNQEWDHILGRIEAICASKTVQPAELLSLLSEQRRMFYQHMYTGLHEFSATLRSAVDNVARELGKVTPELVIQAEDGLLLTPEGEELLSQIFVHILRNAVDHGIEAIDKRQREGKPEQGRIDVAFRVQADALSIDIADDGQGLNLKTIENRAQTLGLIGSADCFSDQERADLIFKPGFSTREQVTLVSGRGVGMDAVKTFVEEHGGQIKLLLSNRPHREPESRYFSLSLRLPRTFIRVLETPATQLAS